MSFIEASPYKIELNYENGQPAPKDWKKAFGKLISKSLNLGDSFDFLTPSKRYEGEFGGVSDKAALNKILITFDYNGHTPEKSGQFIEIIETIISYVQALYYRDASSWNQVKIILMKWAGAYSECELFRFCKLELLRRNLADFINKGIPDTTDKPDMGVWAAKSAEIIDANGMTLSLIVHIGKFKSETAEDETHKEHYEKIMRTRKKTVWIQS